MILSILERTNSIYTVATFNYVIILSFLHCLSTSPCCGRAEISLINFSCYYIFSIASLISSSEKCRVFFTGIGFTHILQDSSGYFFNSGICFGIIQAKSRLIPIVPLNKPVIRFSPALVRCPNLLINFLASSTLLHTTFSFPNCKINFFILFALHRAALRAECFDFPSSLSRKFLTQVFLFHFFLEFSD